MDYKKFLLTVFAIISLNDAIKVNMQGSLSLGKEVYDSVSHFVRRNMVSGRKSMPASKERTPDTRADVVYLIIKSAYLCRDLEFCDGVLENFLNEYITVLTKSIESIFEGILNHEETIDEENKISKPLIFEEELKKCLLEIQKLLRKVNATVKSDENNAYMWTEVIKRICAMFQMTAILFASERLDNTPTDVDDVKKKLMQKFVIATITVEGQFQNKLCSEHDICIKSFECTKALNTILGIFNEKNEKDVKVFIRYISDALIDTGFYTYLSDVTANELQVILNDMAYSDNVQTKNVLMSIHSTVQDRLRSLESKKRTVNEKDVELVHVILSDMDHAYGKRKFDPFHMFLTSFFDWSRTGIKLGKQVRTLLSDLGEQLEELTDDLSTKLIYEVRAFLEITVDPEN